MGMRRELVDFIDTYGHDFLNYLQVISGMAQLNNPPERIREYVLEVTGRIREINRIVKLDNTTAAALLLVFHQRAARYGVPIHIMTDGSPTACPVPDTELEAVLKPVFERLAEHILPSLEGFGETVEVVLAGTGHAYTISFEFPVRPGELIDRLEETAVGADRALHKIGGGCGFQTRDGDVRLFLTLPGREA